MMIGRLSVAEAEMAFQPAGLQAAACPYCDDAAQHVRFVLVGIWVVGLQAMLSNSQRLVPDKAGKRSPSSDPAPALQLCTAIG